MNQILVVIDYQNDFVNGALPCGSAAEKIEKKVYQKIISHTIRKNDIIFTFDTHHKEEYKDSIEGKLFPLHCEILKKGHELYDPNNKMGTFFNRPENLENVSIHNIYKNTYGSYELIEKLKEIISSKEINSIEIIGIATNVCVLHNVIMIYNAFPNIPIFVREDACASWDENLHNQALEIMKSFGINIVRD